MTIPVQVVRPLVLEYLQGKDEGQIATVVGGVATLAAKKKLVDASIIPPGGGQLHTDHLPHEFREALFMHVQQVMWQLLAQGILVWGSDTSNAKYPFYRLTKYGRTVVHEVRPQPYDPDGFLQDFDRTVPNADTVVRDYLEEAVRCFNASCPKGAAVLVGAASEKLVLLLHEKFNASISDPKKKQSYEKDSGGISIHRKYAALKKRLDLMVTAKELPNEHRETIASELPAAFELIRRSRNSAGHPEVPGRTDPDTVFLNLRVFTEYANRTAKLIDYFDTNPADW